MEHGHSIEEIQQRLGPTAKLGYLRDFIYGGIDGAVTTFAIVAGVEGASLSTNVIIVLGIANVLADGFSMAAANYTGTKAELDNVRRLRDVEERHIRDVPEGEREEIRQILILKGLKGDVLEQAVIAITGNKTTWVDMMLVEEYGASPVDPNPGRSALATFAAFLVCGSVPLLPFLLQLPQQFLMSAVLTGVTFFAIGAVKSRWSLQAWWRSALETLLIGSAAAGIAYFAGYLVSLFMV